MSKVVADIYFLSRFPRFMLPQRTLWSQEDAYTLIAHDDLPEALAAVAVDAPAPRSYDEFARAARADVAAWPCLYVHRYNVAGTPPGIRLAGAVAREKAQLVGGVSFVAGLLEQGETLHRYRRVSAGGMNRFEMP